jgi:hypothetical protein
MEVNKHLDQQNKAYEEIVRRIKLIPLRVKT